MKLLAAALVLSGVPVAIACAQPTAPPLAATPSARAPAARCAQLIAYYDRFGIGRSTDSDGRRNHTRIAASLDCEGGDYARGIAAMEALLVAKKFTVPPPGPSMPKDRD